jgi:hypothetical protein
MNPHDNFAEPIGGGARSTSLLEGLARRSCEAVVWFAAIVIVAVMPHPDRWIPGGTPLQNPADTSLDTVAQVVPAIVVAIFVFAVGSLFVVAQVVPPARGTRAVELLRGRFLSWTLSPALALTPLAASLLVLEPSKAKPLASALLLGSVVYLFASTACLLAVLGEATDPTHFGALLSSRHRSALAVLSESPGKGPGRMLSPMSSRNHQSAINDLYGIVRTLRGWARSAATAGDSRELQLALEGHLELIKDYAEVDWERDTKPNPRELVPRDYEHNARCADVNPLYRETPLTRDVTDLEEWASWFPPLYQDSKPVNASKSEIGQGAVPLTWVANEVGRSLVRALEFATTSKTLLDRDRARLILSLEKASRRFAERDDWLSSGVLVAYLIELGLGARRCPAEELDWHFEPLAALAELHTSFCGLLGREKSDSVVESFRPLALGTCAGVLKVAEAIAAARLRAHFERQQTAWDGTIPSTSQAAIEAEAIAQRTVEDLRTMSPRVNLFVDPFDATRYRDKVVQLATSSVLDPRDKPVIHPTKHGAAR